MSLLFLGKANDPHAQRALDFCRLHQPDTVSYLGKWGDPLPEELRCRVHWQDRVGCEKEPTRCTALWRNGDYLISYCSRWIVPAVALNGTRKMALNFHPGPPEYPGFAPVCHALYENDDTFGVTCHKMTPQVDRGEIVWLERFPIYAKDTVTSVLVRTHTMLETLFYNVMARVFSGEELRRWSGWVREPYTRRDLEELSTLTPEMSEAEMRRRIRAVMYDKWRAKMVINGITMEVVG